MKSGETLEQAVVREVREEIGLKVEVMELVAVLDRIFRAPEGKVQFHYVLMDFLCLRKGGRLKASSDAISCVLLPLRALSEYRLTPETREVINRAYQRLNGGFPPVYKLDTLPEIQS